MVTEGQNPGGLDTSQQYEVVEAQILAIIPDGKKSGRHLKKTWARKWILL